MVSRASPVTFPSADTTCTAVHGTHTGQIENLVHCFIVGLYDREPNNWVCKHSVATGRGQHALCLSALPRTP